MKKAISITFAILGIVFLTSMIMNHSSAQSSLPVRKDGTVSKPIPSIVMKIAERSCVKCHTKGGNGMATISSLISIFRFLQSKNEIGQNNLIFANKTKADIILQPFQVGKPIEGSIIATVIESKTGSLTKDDLVLGTRRSSIARMVYGRKIEFSVNHYQRI